MGKKGKQKQQQVQAETVVKILPEVTEEQEDGFGSLVGNGPSTDDWGAGGGEAEKISQDDWNTKLEETPSDSGSGGVSKSKSPQVEHHAILAAAASAVAGKIGEGKDTKGNNGVERGEAKGGVSWGDGGGGKSEGERADGAGWADDYRGNNWDERGGGYDGWEGGQGNGSTWEAIEGEWENDQDTGLGQTSAFLEAAAPPRPVQVTKSAQSGWMSWGEEAKKLAKSYSAQQQSSTKAHPTSGYVPSGKGNAAGAYTQKSEQTWKNDPAKGGHTQKSEPAWYSVPAQGRYTQKSEQAWYNGIAKRGNVEQSDPQKKVQRHSEPKTGKTGKKNKQQQEQNYQEHRGRSQRQSIDGWGGWRNDENDWGNDGNDWRDDGNDWKTTGNDWRNDGNDWGNSGNDWGNSGNDWGNDGNDWGNSGNDWENSGNDWGSNENDWGNSGNDWGNMRNKEEENDNDPWNRRVHFSPKKKALGPSGPSYSMPSKTMAHAYSSLPLPHTFHHGPVQNTMNDYADVRFVESKGAALEPVKQALFGKARLAKDRIHWMFPSDKDERVASLLSWIQTVSYNLGGFGLHKFLQSRERGALVANADFRPDKSVNEPSFDWLTFDQLQATRDRILQESVAFYDPAVQVIVFVFLPSKSGNSMAIWRRKIKVPNNLRLTYQREITLALAALRKDKDYIVHVDELPDKKAEAQRRSLFSKTPHKSPIDLKPPKPKRKWWQIFG